MSETRDPISVLQRAIESPMRAGKGTSTARETDAGGGELNDQDLAEYLRASARPRQDTIASPGEVDASPAAPEKAALAPSQAPDGLKDGRLTYAGEVIDLPRDLPVDEVATSRFTAFARREKLSPAQVRGVLAFEAERQRAATSAQADQERTWREQSLRQFSASQIEAAQQLIKAHGDDDLAKFLNQSGFGSHPAVINLLASVARARAEEEW